MSKAEAAAPRPDPAAVFAALGDPTRLALVARLADGTPRSIRALAEGGALTRQAVAKHLAVLERAGLVAGVKTGREHRFIARPETIGEAREYLDRVAAQWDAALGRLRAFVEG